ncbi:hypothetical protein ACHAPT_010974 [Fusarium lateritium]
MSTMDSLSAANAFEATKYAWPADKTCLKVRFLKGSSWERKTVKHYVNKYYLEVPMNIGLDFLDDDASVPSDIRIGFGRKNWSRVGRDAQKYPDQRTMELNLHPSSRLSKDEQQIRRRRAILHMFGHALGIQFEHGYSARCETVASQSDAYWSSLSTVSGDLDQSSVMYCQPGECDTRGGETTGPLNTRLSDGDKSLLVGMYPKPERKKSGKAPAKTSKSHEKSKNGTTSASATVEGCDPSKATVVSGSGSFNVDGGGHVTLSGCGTVHINGNSHVTLSGRGDVWVDGNSHVTLSGCGSVWVDGNGYAEISGVGKVCFSGKGSGIVTGIGEISSHVSMKK